jgi:hypothetical protein
LFHAIFIARTSPPVKSSLGVLTYGKAFNER